MDIEIVKKIITDWAASKPLITKVYIYGSRALGNHKADSDLDVAIEIQKEPNDSCTLATWCGEEDDLKDSLQPQIPYKLHLVLLNGDRPSTVLSGVKKSSILIYKKNTTMEAM